MNPGVDPVKVSQGIKIMLYIVHFFLLQDAYPDGDRHLMQDSKLFQVCA